MDKLHEECGVFAIHGHPEAANLTYLGLYALQHRGQESAGIASSDGGLAVAVAESSFGPAGVGAELDLDSGMRAEFLLFHEGPSRILVSTDKPDEVAAVARRHGVEAPRVGATIEGRVVIRHGGTVLVDRDVSRLKEGWAGSLERMLRG